VLVHARRPSARYALLEMSCCFKSDGVLVGLVALVAIGPASCSATGFEGPTTDAADCAGWSTLRRLSPMEATDLITHGDPIVINVHTPYAGDIPGTDATIPFDDVAAIETYLRHDHCADVLLVCQSGSMSENAGNTLVRHGYLRLRDLKGGMAAWKAAGYPLLEDGGS